MAESFSKTLVTLYPLTPHHIPEELYLHHHCC